MKPLVTGEVCNLLMPIGERSLLCFTLSSCSQSIIPVISEVDFVKLVFPENVLLDNSAIWAVQTPTNSANSVKIDCNDSLTKKKTTYEFMFTSFGIEWINRHAKDTLSTSTNRIMVGWLARVVCVTLITNMSADLNNRKQKPTEGVQSVKPLN